MRQRKMCMVGAYAVGKTSLTRRFVHSLFSEEYLTTIGVKVDRKDVKVEGTAVRLMIWDLVGEDEFTPLSLSHVRGAAGYFLVVDRTRPKTLDIAVQIQERIASQLGPIPFLVLFNKADLEGEGADFDLSLDDVVNALPRTRGVIQTSAKTGMNVESSFTQLAEIMLDDYDFNG